MRGVEAGDPGLRTAIDHLLAAKRAGAELDRGARIPAISDFLDGEMARWEVWGAAHQQPAVSSAPLDELFRASLAEVWGTGAPQTEE